MGQPAAFPTVTEAAALRAQRAATAESEYRLTRAAVTATLATGRQRGTDPAKLRRLEHYLDVLDQSYLDWCVRDEVDAMQRGAA